jgi:uncharacterized protein YgbK (DUF1537 family)
MLVLRKFLAHMVGRMRRANASMIPKRWLILADDLTGAADCGIAFTRHGLPAAVTWHAEGWEDAVVAIDADSRAHGADAAAAKHRRLIEARHEPGIGLFKKIDSTLRGQPAAELAETIRALRERGETALAIVAPAFPETGRTLHRGAIHVHGEPLEATPLWAREHSYDTADIVAVLNGVGLRVCHAGLDTLREGPEAMGSRVRRALSDGTDAIVCDADVATDLDIVARATLALSEHLFWTGSAGLAQALARSLNLTAAPPERPAVNGGMLFVVGSIAEASRAAAGRLAASAAICRVVVDADALVAGPDNEAWRRAQAAVTGTLGDGEDVLVEIAPGDHPDLTQGAALAQRLAELTRPAAPAIGALFVTGGETAIALLKALGATGIRLIEEVEPGVPFGVTRGTRAVPVITKAGAFGGPETLLRCLQYFRRLRPTENPA